MEGGCKVNGGCESPFPWKGGLRIGRGADVVIGSGTQSGCVKACILSVGVWKRVAFCTHADSCTCLLQPR